MTLLPPQDNEKLMADYVSGDDSALNKIISKNLPVVYSTTFYMVGNSHDAEDVTQETFLKVWKNAKKYKPGQSFKAWLLTIARNTARDFLRKKKDVLFSNFENDEGDNMFVDNLTDDAPTALQNFLGEEDKRILESVLSEIPFYQREVVVLRYSSNLTFDEIGKIVGRPLHTVKSQHRRALLEIKKRLKRNAPNYEV